MIYQTVKDNIELVAIEEESGWITMIPIVSGKQENSYTCISMDVAVKEAKRRFNLKELEHEDFKVSIESTDFEGVTE